jgi:putative transposase
MGLLLAVVVHPADIQDRDGAKLVLQRLLGRFPRLKLIWADGAYAGKLVRWAKRKGGWLLELVRRPAQQHPPQAGCHEDGWWSALLGG